MLRHLEWTQQTSPFHAVFERTDRVEMIPESLRIVLMWDAFNVLLTMIAGEEGEVVAPTYVLATNFCTEHPVDLLASSLA